MKEEFQLDGYWWLPGQEENQVFGQLNFVPGGKINLKLYGALNSPPEKAFIRPPEFIEPIVIQGSDSSQGNDLTLYKCRQIGHSTTFTGLQTTSFIATAAFKGVLFKEDSEVKFRSVSVRFSNLEEWTNKHPIGTEHANGEWQKLVIKYEHPNSICALINGFEIKVVFYGPNYGPSRNSFTVSYETRVEISSQQDIAFEEYLTIIRRLQNFFSLAMGMPTFPISVRGISNANKEITEDGREFLSPIDIYYLAPWWPEEVKEYHRSQMLFTLETIEEDFSLHLQNWMDIFELIEPAINLYFSVLYNPSSYAELKYLSLAQALETYHHRMFGGKYQADEVYQAEVYELLVSAIPTTLDADFKRSLQNRLIYGNEFSLRKRLNEIIKSVEDVLDFDFIKSKKGRENFVSKAVNTRNYWTHYSPNLASKAAQTHEERLVLLTRLQLLLEIRFLKELGFDGQKIRDLLQRSERFKLLKARHA